MEPTEVKQQILTYLEEVLSFESSKLVGKLLKRFEIITDQELLKKEAKELIYESFRDVREIVSAYGKGVEVTYFKFKNKKE